jgi:hypothetical protein
MNTSKQEGETERKSKTCVLDVALCYGAAGGNLLPWRCILEPTELLTNGEMKARKCEYGVMRVKYGVWMRGRRTSKEVC